MNNKLFVTYITAIAMICIPCIGAEKKLLNAAICGELHEVKYLVKHGTNINHQDNKGTTALIYAAWNGRFSVVVYLVELGATINHHNTIGNTALVAAAEKRHFEVARHLFLYDQSDTQYIKEHYLLERIRLHPLSQNIILHTEQDDRMKAVQAHIQDLHRNPLEYKQQLPEALGYALGKSDLVAYLLQHVSPHARLCDYNIVFVIPKTILITPITIIQTILRQTRLSQEQREAYIKTQTLLAQAAAVRMRLIVRLLSHKLPDELGEHIFMFMHPEYTPEFRTLVLQDQKSTREPCMSSAKRLHSEQ